MTFSEKPKQGRLVIFEGVDGAGKTEASDNLVRELNNRGLNATLFKTHAGDESPYWKSVMASRNQLRVKLGRDLNYEVDRAIHILEFLSLARSVLPVLLSENNFVIADRYTLSRIVSPRIRYDLKTEAETLIEIADDIPKPDFAFYLNVSIKVAMYRIKERNTEKEWKEEREMLVKAAELYARALKSLDYYVINANVESGQVLNAVLSIILQHEN